MNYFLLSFLLVSNVFFKVFTNHYRILPKIFNVIDVAIVGLIFAYYMFNREEKWEIPEYNWVFYVLVAFNMVLLVGFILNREYVYLKPALSQVIMYNEPFILFLSIINMPLTEDDINRYRNLFVLFLVVQIAIGVLQLPAYLSTRDSEKIIGTFQHNAEQYAAFILLAVYFIIGKSKIVEQMSFMYYIAVLLVIALILLIDNKASWLGVTCSILFIYVLLLFSGEIITDKLKYVVGFSVIVLIGFIVIVNKSATLTKFERIYESYDSGNFYQLGKLKAYQDILASYKERLHTAFAGSGPATFYSRSSRQYFFLTEDMYYAGDFEKKTVEEYNIRESNAMGGVISKIYKEPYFKRFYRNSKIFLVGSGQVDEPYSSIAALLGETGIVGSILYLGVYIVILTNMCGYFVKYRTIESMFPMIITVIGFMVYTIVVSFYNNWMETGRMMTILWSLAGVVVKHASIIESEGELRERGVPAWYEVPQNV